MTDADTGKPVRMALVTLARAGDRSDRFTRTSADGRYEFRDLPAGPYTITVSKARYATTPWRRGTGGSAATPIDVAAGARLEQLDVVLPRAAAITGRITDEFGDPLERASVVAMRPGFNERGRTMTSAGSAATDDAGVYRIAGLQPGDYVVVAGERSDGFGSAPDADIGFLRTAYPSATSTRDAKLVSVRAGQDATGIDISLIPAKNVRIAGRVVTSNGLTASGAWLVLQPIGDGPGIGIGGDARSGTDGSFLFPAVAPGRYDLHVRLQRSPNEGAVIPLTVTDDITNWDIGISAGGTLRGRFVLPEDAKLAPRGVNVSVTPVTETLTFGTGFGGPPKEDWTFDATFLLGPRVIRVGGLPPGWFVSRITRGAEDLTDATIDFKRDEVVDDVEIHLAQGSPVITGSAVLANAKPAEQYAVVAFSEDPKRWGPHSRYVASVRSDDKGLFTLEGLPPGRYHVAAVADLLPFQWTDREFLESLRAAATEVTLERGARATVTLRVDR